MKRAEAERRDRDDPLAAWVDEFVVTDSSLVYFDGNSLGRLPLRTAARLQAATAEWGDRLVRGWDSWIDLPTVVGDKIGCVALGAGPGQVTLGDSTTVNFFKLAAAAVAVRPGRRVIVTDARNFPTDRFVLEGLAPLLGIEVRLVATDPVMGVQPADVRAAVDGDVALVTFSHVDFRSGAIADVAAITGAAHAAGALTLWDLSHAAGAVPVALDAWGVDLATGCTYKYLNGGPGAPAWLYVTERLQSELTPPIWGWFGASDQFAMADRFIPAPGITRWISGTPPVLAIAAVDEGIGMIGDAGMAAIRAKGMALTAFAEDIWRQWLAPLGFGLGSPPERGSHVALVHPEAHRLSRALVTEARVVPDFRPPDVLRIGLSPLSTRFTDVWDGLDRLRRLSAEQAWTRYDVGGARVT